MKLCTHEQVGYIHSNVIEKTTLYSGVKLDTKIVEGSGISMLGDGNKRVTLPCCYYCANSLGN